MLLLASAFFLTLLQCSNAQNKVSITPADCNTVERDAGVALDLVNRHRRDGYVFGLFRVADAHELHIGNSSVLYLTLDVLETECPVLSRRHWESCEYSDLYSTDFGQCKIIMHTSQLLKKPHLYGFNCTLSSVPPDLLECKDCPVKIEILEVIEQHKNIAEKALKKFNSESNHTNYFHVDKVEKILKMTASRQGHILGFSIKETNCSKSTQQADQALECDFLDDWHAHVGFCKARIISDTDEADGTDISCEIYHPWQHDYGHRCRYSHTHHHFGHRHPHRHHHKHGCPPSSQSRPEGSEHTHSFNEEHQDSHEGPAPAPPPHHGGPHDHPPPPPHDGPHSPPQEEPQHPPSPPHEEPHNPPPPPPGPHCPPPHGPHHHHPHHGPHCPPPPPHDPHHHHPHHGPHCPPPPPHDPHHLSPPDDGQHSPSQEETQHPPSAPPPHDEPHLPSPPPPHEEPHNPPPGHHHGPHCPPHPPHGPHGPPPPPHCGPHHHHPPPPPHCGPHHHYPRLYYHYYRHHCDKASLSGTVYRIPVLNQQDSLTPPTANFPKLFHSFSSSEGIPFTDSSLKEMPEALGFPDHPTQSESCPGKPKLIFPNILPLFPHGSMAEKSPT